MRSLVRNGLFGASFMLCASTANAQSLTISAPFDVTNEFGAVAAGAVGDITPVVIPGPSNTAFLGFIRIEGMTHVTGLHSIIVRSVTASSATTGTTLLGRTSDMAQPFATSLALTSEGTTPIAVYGLTDNTVSARPIMGFPSPAPFGLVPISGAMIPSGDSIADVSVPIFASTFDIGITTHSTTATGAGHLFSLGISGSPGSFSLTGRQNPIISTTVPRAMVRAAGPGGSFSALFLDYNPNGSVSLFVHQADGTALATANTISTARPGFTALASGDYLVVLNPETATPSGPTQLQCKILTTSSTPMLNGSTTPCPLVPIPPVDIVAAADSSTPDGAWIGGAFGDRNPMVFIALNGSSAPPTIAPAGESFAGCGHPSVAAIDSTHAVITALCGIPLAAPHVLIWIATKPAINPDAGVPDAAVDAANLVDAAADATNTDSGLADAANTDSGLADAANDVSAAADSTAMTDTAPTADVNTVSFRGGGCGCRTALAPPRGTGLVALSALALFASRRRRRGSR